ncbi:MAG: ParA family protein [Helicobacter trogontum]|uniref:ParA family protein n=1 Tax=Helicobacter trogontum TaxID=50960 RepID=UPI00242CA896|nr:ParA family protein [Helicobacter trogontum]MCI5787004.1 ParA family protein [Helicobacter trogontum]
MNLNIKIHILFLIPKGGVGKSTIAINLARFFTLQTHDILLLDTDPQRSVFLWHSCSNDKRLQVKYAKETKEINTILNQHRFVIADTSGSDRGINAFLIERSDVCVIPINVGAFNIIILNSIIDYLQKIMRVNKDLRAYMIINRANSNPKIKQIETLKEIIKSKQSNIYLLNSVLFERVAYQHATDNQVSLFDYCRSNDKALIEFKDFCNEILVKEIHGNK